MAVGQAVIPPGAAAVIKAIVGDILDNPEKFLLPADEKGDGDEDEPPQEPADDDGTLSIEKLYKLFEARLEQAEKDKQYPAFYKTMGGTLKLRFVDVPAIPEPVLMFIETHRLTSFPGDYGAGTTVKTFSLLPSEETEISIKTWKKSETSIKEASSILDSYTDEKANEFEEGCQTENSNQSKVEQSSSYKLKASAKAKWGWGSASASADKSGGSNSAREEASKNIMNETVKSSQSSSAKRDVNIDTSYERKDETSEETAIMRRIKNLNASRTLNFVFRQMNQEFHSILHMTDVRVGFFNGYPGMREYSLYELGDLITDDINVPKILKEEVEAALIPANFTLPGNPSGGPAIVSSGQVQMRAYLENLIMAEYGTNGVFNYQGDPKPFLEKIKIPPGGSTGYTYLRVIPPRKDSNTGDQIGRQKYVMREEDPAKDQQEDSRYLDGIILSARKLTMKTDGVIVESLLGKAAALDRYALDTQIEVLRERELNNNRVKSGLDLIEKLKDDGEYEKAVDAYQKMFVPQPKAESSE